MILNFSLFMERDGRRYRFEGSAEEGILGIVGPSGSGKTTLLRLLAGLERPDDGIVELGGRVLTDTRTGLYLAPEQRRIGLLFQEARLFPHMSVERNIRFAMTAGRRHAAGSPRPEPLIDILGIRPLLNRRPAGLSGGERQRVALARSLMARPDCLLLDEPFGALDPDMRSRLLPILADLRRSMEIPMVMVSHQVDDLATIADRILRIDDGLVEIPGRRPGPLEAVG